MERILIALSYGLLVAGGILAIQPSLIGWVAATLAVAVAGRFFLAAPLADKPEAESQFRDVRAIPAGLSQMRGGFDPEKFWDPKKGIFWGLDTRRQPTFVPLEQLQKNHIQILGASGGGKTSQAGNLLAQLAIGGETVIVFDPKPDAMLPGALARVAKKHSIPFHLVDLSPKAPPQLNPLVGTDVAEQEELLQAALELGKSGDPKADFHRGEDREAALQAAELGCSSLPELAARALGVEEIAKRQNFARELRQLASLPVFQTSGGLDLHAAVQQPGILYVSGSTENDRVFLAQRLLLQRTLQLIRQTVGQRKQSVCLFQDELKYLLSVPALRALGTIRDRNCHLILAHQSLGDLADCGGLPRAAVEGAVLGNTTIKICYRLTDPATAEWFARLAGQQPGTQAQASQSRDPGGAKPTETSGWREVQAERFPAHLFTSLPKPIGDQAAVSVTWGLPGVAFLSSTRWIASGLAPVPIEASHLEFKGGGTIG